MQEETTAADSLTVKSFKLLKKIVSDRKKIFKTPGEIFSVLLICSDAAGSGSGDRSASGPVDLWEKNGEMREDAVIYNLFTLFKKPWCKMTVLQAKDQKVGGRQRVRIYQTLPAPASGL
jgi:hypothetical protein